MTKRHSVPQTNVRPVTRKEFSNTAYGGGTSSQAVALQGRSKQLAEHILKSVDAQDYAAVCSLTRLAAHFQTTGPTLRSFLRIPVQLELLTIQNDCVYPTPRFLCENNPKLSMNEAARIIRSLEGA